MLENQQPGASARTWAVFGLATAVSLALDAVTKNWAVAHLRPPEGRPWVLWEGVLEFAFAFNRGTAFSVIREVEYPIVFLPIGIAMLIWIVYMVRRAELDRWGLVGLGLVAGGAFGNLFDRFFREDAFGRHGVVDFIVVHYPWGGSWPSFNVADATLVVGTLVLMWKMTRQSK